MKRGPLSKAEKFYIQQHQGNLDILELCDDLDRSKEQVQKYIDELNKGKKNPKETHMKKVMDQGTHKRNGQPVAKVMTPAASEYSDIIRPSYKMKKVNQEAIHKPMG